jgi:hypothetical protein
MGRPRLERVVGQADGYRLAGVVAPGDWVALHWDWVCDTLSPARLASLRHYAARHLAIANRTLAERHAVTLPSG